MSITPAGLDTAPRTPDASGDGQRRLRAVAREFESLLVSTLLRSMRSTIPEAGLIDDQGDIKYYRQLYDDELAKAVTQNRHGLGIADLIVRQYGGQAEPTATAAAVPLLRAMSESDTDTEWPLALPQPAVGSAVPVAKRPPPPLMAVAAPTPADAPVVASLPTLAGNEARGLAAYRGQAVQEARAADLAALRAAASREGGAVADSLRRFEPEITEAASNTGVDPALLLSVLVQESGGDPRARSARGAIGLMQLMPGTAAEVGVRQPQHPGQNVLGGARYLAKLLDRFNSSLDLALAGYNAGPGAVERHGGSVPPYRETQKYVARVGALYDRLRYSRGTNLATEEPDRVTRIVDRERGEP